MEIQIIQNKIYEIRGQKVMLDFDLANLYEVETKNLNLAVKRNIERFPADFMFQLTKDEWESLRLQIATSNNNFLRLQNETLEKRGGRRYLPYAFTEQGLAMLSGILSSKKAITVNIAIMRAFVMIRQYYMNYKELKLQIEKLEKEMNRKFKDINEALHFLLEPPQPPRKRIGYKIPEKNK
ncbi:MAG: ORF6N domain-containing protein [Bacteroidales bacterium]|jgi:hypothetical protein